MDKSSIISAAQSSSTKHRGLRDSEKVKLWPNAALLMRPEGRARPGFGCKRGLIHALIGTTLADTILVCCPHRNLPMGTFSMKHTYRSGQISPNNLMVIYTDTTVQYIICTHQNHNLSFMICYTALRIKYSSLYFCHLCPCSLSQWRKQLKFGDCAKKSHTQ